jgi:hypothetical protein
LFIDEDHVGSSSAVRMASEVPFSKSEMTWRGIATEGSALKSGGDRLIQPRATSLDGRQKQENGAPEHKATHTFR